MLALNRVTRCSVVSAVLLGSASVMSASPQPLLGSPSPTPDPRLKTVKFAADSVLDVPVRRGQITQIVLGDDEQMVGSPLSGQGSNCNDESHTWCIGTQGRDVFVKPKLGATATNLIVVTDRRRHVFLLHPVEGAGLTLMRLTVAAPPPVEVAVLTAPPTAKELIDARWQAKPLVRNTAYSVATGKDSEDIVPVLVFDDGTQTYFSFPNNRPIPAVFQIAADGSEEMVNARMDTDDMLVADRVGRRFVLRLGESVAAIMNDAFNIDGAPPVDGTTVPGVARVIRAPASNRAAP